jgi:antitoxin CptB
VTNNFVSDREEKNRVLWRCRQGTRELELLLSGYVDQHYESLSRDERSEMQQLLEHNSNELSDWLLYGENSNSESLKPLITKIRNHYIYTD